MHFVSLHHLEIFLCVFASAYLSRFETTTSTKKNDEIKYSRINKDIKKNPGR